MIYFYAILSVCILIYLLVKKREIDFLSIYVFSALIYYFPAYLGYTIEGGNYQIDIINKTYFLLMLNLLIVFSMILLKDLIINSRRSKNDLHINQNEKDLNLLFSNKAILLLSFVNLLLIIVSIYQYSGDIFNGNFNKVSLLSESSKITEYTKLISTFIFVYSFISRGIHIIPIRLLSLFGIGYTFILGHRSFLVIAVIAILYFKFLHNYQSKNLIRFFYKYKGRVLFILVFTAMVFFVKNVFAALLSGNYSLVFERLTTPSYYTNALLTSEPNVITSNLNMVLLYNMKYDVWSYIASFSLVLFPFIGGRIAEQFDITSFSYMLQINFNKQFHEGIGIGSTFIGEAYSSGGIGMVFLIIVLICILIDKLDKILKKSTNPLVNSWLLVSLVLFSFYINRNSLDFTLFTIRSYLYIMIFCLLVKWFIKKLYRSN